MKTEQHATEHTTDKKDVNTKMPDTGKDSKDIHNKMPDTGKDSKECKDKVQEKGKDTKITDVKETHHEVKGTSDNKDKDHHVNK